MLDKLNTTLRSVPDRVHRFRLTVSGAVRRQASRIRPMSDRIGFDVIRHRVRSGSPMRRQLVVVLAAAVGLGVAVVGVNATVGADPRPAVASNTASGEYATLLERQAAAQRADRRARDEPAAEEAAEPAPEQTRLAAEPEESPTPEPEPEPEQTAEPPPDWVHPMPGARTTSCFGPRWGTLHGGVDLAAPHGTPIHAVGAGTVTHSGWVFGGYGISVVIDHHDGHYTHYAHASEAKVSAGDKVEPGDVIALEGSTGDSTGPHLHFEVHKGSLWNQVEPTRWMSNRDVHIGGC